MSAVPPTPPKRGQNLDAPVPQLLLRHPDAPSNRIPFIPAARTSLTILPALLAGTPVATVNVRKRAGASVAVS